MELRSQPSRFVRVVIAGLLLSGGAVALTSDPANAASIVVNSLADGPPAADGSCTLREAIDSANTDTAVGGCTAGTAGDDTITFVVTGTITLTEGELKIDDDITITGPGATKLTIDGAQNGRIFRIANLIIDENDPENSDPTNAEISGMALVNGHDACVGGAIYTRSTGTLTLRGLWVHDNSAGGECPGYGGGIAGDTGAVISVINSTISSNVASGTGMSDALGGGIAVSDGGSLSIVNSTISGNSATTDGEDPRFVGFGGGIYTTNPDASLFNLTITNNTADYGGGLYVSVGGDRITRVGNTIIAGNNAGFGEDCFGVLVSTDHNLFGLIDDSYCVVQGLTTSNRGGAAGLGPLQNNGGETPTHALLDGSQAIDAGDPQPPSSDSDGAPVPCQTTDQRGVSRPMDGDAVPGAICDIGAFEKELIIIATTTTETTTTAAPTTTTTAAATTTTATATATPTTAAPTTTAQFVLPATGASSSSDDTALVAAAFLLLGAGLVLMVRRRTA